MQEHRSPICAKCAVKVCDPKIAADELPDLESAPLFCPMRTMPDLIEQAARDYQEVSLREFARQASIQEFECYEKTTEGRRAKNPRILELIQFSRKCGYRKLGLAFCAGLADEARRLSEILEGAGFEMVSVRCKVGAQPKESIGIKPDEKIRGPLGWESMCNPITQAEILNAEQVDLAVMLGLCIVHDTLFFKYCRVPVTVIAVKDRVTGHNPLASLYLSDSYYKYLNDA